MHGSSVCAGAQRRGAASGRDERSVSVTHVPSAAHSQAGPLHARTVPA